MELSSRRGIVFARFVDYSFKKLQNMLSKKKPSPIDLFRSQLKNILDMTHSLCKLSREIDWSAFESELGHLYSETMGRPGKELRLMVGIHYLKHAFNESDESVVERWLENPYWQYFCGCEYFQHAFPCDSSLLPKWRKRIGEERMATLLTRLLDVAKNRGELSKREVVHVNVDTTVQEKAIAFPTDAELYYKMLTRLVAHASRSGVALRQSYKRVSKKALIMQGRYRHAKQHKRANRELRKLKTWLGRVVRDLERKCCEPDEALKQDLDLAGRLFLQQRNSKNKIYSLHAPEVECISKGKAHKRYEFGCKVSVVHTSKSNWIVGVKAHHGNPFDGHTLGEALDVMEAVTGLRAKHVHVDKGYRGHGIMNGEPTVHLPGKGRGKHRQTRTERKWQRRRSAVEPVIGHLKNDNRMDRNYLLGRDGDEINAILAACGYNFRKLLKLLLSRFWGSLFSIISGPQPNFNSACENECALTCT